MTSQTAGRHFAKCVPQSILLRELCLDFAILVQSAKDVPEHSSLLLTGWFEIPRYDDVTQVIVEFHQFIHHFTKCAPPSMQFREHCLGFVRGSLPDYSSLLLIGWFGIPRYADVTSRRRLHFTEGIIRYGIPKGSILVPLLLCIFINDLFLHITSDAVNCEMFADDMLLNASDTITATVENE